MNPLYQRLRDAASGTIEWRVQNPETRAYCISFTEWEGGERNARQWLDEEIRARPESIFAKHEVARVVALDHRDRLMLEAADRLDEQETAVAQAVAFAQYVEDHAKGGMVEAARKFLSLPFSQEIAARLKRVDELEAERADDDALRERMSDILKRTAIALRGPEPPLTAWSWHDLPERAAAAIASIDLFQRVAHNLADPRGLVPMLVDRFLAWKLPEDFAPDCGISFKRESDYEHPQFGRTKYEPVGTNLFTAVQATAMFEHLLGIDPPLQDGVELIDGCDCTCSVIQAAHGHHAGCPAKDGA